MSYEYYIHTYIHTKPLLEVLADLIMSQDLRTFQQRARIVKGKTIHVVR